MAYNPNNPNGQATMVNSAPVTLASNQSALPITDNSGSLTVDNAGTFATQVDGAALTALQLIDNPVATDGAAAVTGLFQVGGTDGTNAQILSTNASGHLNIADGSNSITVDNSGTFVVQENGAALTALQLIDDSVATLGTTTYTEATSKGLIVGVVRRDADTTLVDTTNEVTALQVNAGGQLKTSLITALPAGTNNIGDVDVLTVPADPFGVNADASSATGSISAKLRFIAGTGIPITGTVTVGAHAVTNAGTFATQVDGAALTALQLIDNTVFVDDAAFTVATSSVNAVGFLADETSTDSVDEGDIGAARMTLDRKIVVVPQPHTAGGLSIFRSLDIDETEEEVKATAGTIYSVWVTNTATATRWLKFYNATAASVTVGTTTPLITIGIPGNSSDDISGNFAGGGFGITFDTAICVAATTGFADADVGAPATNDVFVNVFYK